MIDSVDQHKTCSKCKLTKPLVKFATQTRSKDNYSPWCKACHAAHNVAWRRGHPSPARVLLTEEQKRKLRRDRQRRYYQENPVYRQKVRAAINRYRERKRAAMKSI